MEQTGDKVPPSVRDPDPGTGLIPRSCLGLAKEARARARHIGDGLTLHSVATVRFIGSSLVISSYHDDSFTSGKLP